MQVLVHGVETLDSKLSLRFLESMPYHTEFYSKVSFWDGVTFSSIWS